MFENIMAILKLKVELTRLYKTLILPRVNNYFYTQILLYLDHNCVADFKRLLLEIL